MRRGDGAGSRHRDPRGRRWRHRPPIRPPVDLPAPASIRSIRSAPATRSTARSRRVSRLGSRLEATRPVRSSRQRSDHEGGRARGDAHARGARAVRGADAARFARAAVAERTAATGPSAGGARPARLRTRGDRACSTGCTEPEDDASMTVESSPAETLERFRARRVPSGMPSMAIGEIDQTSSTCPVCGGPCDRIVRRCPGCRDPTRHRVQMRNGPASSPPLGLMVGVGVGGGVASLLGGPPWRTTTRAPARRSRPSAALVEPGPPSASPSPRERPQSRA